MLMMSMAWWNEWCIK